MLRFGLFFMAVLSLLTSCIQKRAREINYSIVYLDYMAWGDEANDTVTLKLQYRRGWRNGDPMLLNPPAKVELDGTIISADSTAFTGTYYEMLQPVNQFKGKHTIVFTDSLGNQCKTVFNFPVFSLKQPVPDTVTRGDLVFELDGLEQDDEIRLIFTDTSFYGRGLERADVWTDNRITISKEDLRNLKNGPVHLEIMREEEINPAENADRPGRLYISYNLERSFILQDGVAKTPQ